VTDITLLPFPPPSLVTLFLILATTPNNGHPYMMPKGSLLFQKASWIIPPSNTPPWMDGNPVI